MNMFASVLHLDRHAMKALRITDAYSLHRVVYSLFENIRGETQKAGSTTSGILYADQGGDVRHRRILLLSNREPQTAVNGKYGDVQSKAIPANFLDYSRYRFKVVVNPTRRDNVSRKLMAVRGRENVSQWFMERAPRSWGFEVQPEHLQVDKIEVLKFRGKENRPITIGQAHVQGTLQVTDKEQFTTSFRQGIGRARAFGCGLLQIVPLVDHPFA